MSITITISFELAFIVNLIVFWYSYLNNNKNPKFYKLYKSIFPYIWTTCLVGALILNSNFLWIIFPDNFSYFQNLWIWFLMLGVVFVIIGFKIISMVRKLFKVKVVNSDNSKLVTSGPYSLVRHPIYLAWILIFTGWSMILDSPLAILFIPFLIISLSVHSIYEEKHMLIPKYGEHYVRYIEKIPYRIFSPPYNYLAIIIAIIVLYIGLANILFPK
jgi:protein-S-isoprenylcysteine O-methyltransferase Ste14